MKSKFFCFLVLLTTLTRGEPAEGQSKAFCAIAPGLAPLTLTCRYGSHRQTLDIPEGLPSARIELDSKAPLLLEFSDQSHPSRIFKTELTPSASRSVLVFYLSHDGVPAVYVVPDSPNAFPVGSVAILNLGNTPFSVSLAGEKRPLVPQGLEVFNIPESRTALVQLFSDPEGKLIFSGNWSGPGKSKALAILEPQTDSSPVPRFSRFIIPAEASK